MGGYGFLNRIQTLKIRVLILDKNTLRSAWTHTIQNDMCSKCTYNVLLVMHFPQMLQGTHFAKISHIKGINGIPGNKDVTKVRRVSDMVRRGTKGAAFLLRRL